MCSSILCPLRQTLVKYLCKDQMTSFNRHGKVICMHQVALCINQCKNVYERSAYLSVIKTHEIRNIFTRLRVDMNILASCRYRQPSAPVSPMCQTGIEDIEHFILVCPTWHHLRSEFFRSVQVFWPSLAKASNLEKNNYILDLTRGSYMSIGGNQSLLCLWVGYRVGWNLFPSILHRIWCMP